MAINYTRKQQAQIRNHTKLKLMGFCLNTEMLTEDEKELYTSMRKIQKVLIKNWDENTAKLDFKVLQHHCDFCNKKVSDKYSALGRFYCKKHFLKNMDDEVHNI